MVVLINENSCKREAIWVVSHRASLGSKQKASDMFRNARGFVTGAFLYQLHGNE
jgi:hypothetical protein